MKSIFNYLLFVPLMALCLSCSDSEDEKEDEIPISYPVTKDIEIVQSFELYPVEGPFLRSVAFAQAKPIDSRSELEQHFTVYKITEIPEELLSINYDKYTLIMTFVVSDSEPQGVEHKLTLYQEDERSTRVYTYGVTLKVGEDLPDYKTTQYYTGILVDKLELMYSMKMEYDTIE